MPTNILESARVMRIKVSRSARVSSEFVLIQACQQCSCEAFVVKDSRMSDLSGYAHVSHALRDETHYMQS
jgi:hypothetical protein